MTPISYASLHYPTSIVPHADWLYLRFSLSLLDVDDLLAGDQLRDGTVLGR